MAADWRGTACSRERLMGGEDSAGQNSGKHLLKGVPALVALATFIVFLPALRNGFVAWDDDKNFLTNPDYRGLGLSQLHWMWTTFHLGHYVPLSWMTLGLDYELWGMDPIGYHLTSQLLHAANAVLVYFLARRLLSSSLDAGLRSTTITFAAAVAGLLFAIHPLRVESVVWITERRDVLSGFFGLLTVLLYLRAMDASETRKRWYAASVAAFICALFSKAIAITIPVVLLILNFYPMRRLGGRRGWRSQDARRVYFELTPFVLLATTIALLSIVALEPPPQLSLQAKLAVSAYSLGFYLLKTLIPTNLSPVYEMPQHIDATAPRFLLSYAIVGAFIGATWIPRRRWPGAAAACLAFLAVILPMLGVIQNGPQIAADRYTYHAAPALAILAGGGLVWAERSVGSLTTRWLVSGLLVALGTLTWRQTHVWHDSEMLWTRVLALDDNSSVGHVGWANLLLKKDRVDEAEAHATRAVAIAPDYAQAHNDLGVALARRGKLDEAANEYLRALSIEPANDEARSNLGVVTARLGDYNHAIELFRQALAANANNADAHVNWGNALVRLGMPEDAIDHYRLALDIRPDDADAEHNWGVALAREGKLDDAVEHFRRALGLDPNHAEARDYLEQATRILHARRQ